MTLSSAAQAWEEAKARRLHFATLNLLRFAFIEQLSAYQPRRGAGESSLALTQCQRKSGRYRTRADAERVRDKYEGKHGEPLRVYGCVFCGLFHLTSHVHKRRSGPRLIARSA